jgi:23S rRNA (adenine2503-C2)-methyltransferase
MIPALTGQSPESLAAFLKEAGEPSFRAAQILEWLWKKKVTSYDQMTNLPLALRQKLAEAFRLTSLEHRTTQGAADTTRKFLFRLHDPR